ncbi:class I SAM-dependent methyltransferase [Hyphomicrobium sp. CS1GBMeth3]|uniref:class I SAM-dependent methyltransferase n=1 Tax=Hyphomicrobium sp. CS1GBMeth3 TaxID=1892845 RepID=UPI00092FF0BE|nr:class I SAM-dependent methyltransferase [Hyphomicrobium sp. CS1GBMeth3]
MQPLKALVPVRLKKAIKRLVAPRQPSRSVSLYTYRKPDGTFDLDRYREVQIAGNKRKLDWVFADEDTIRFISSYLRNSSKMPVRGLCHGTRRGLEQQWFADHLGAEMIGTEISDTADQFPRTVQWDFHEPRAEWEGRFDFVYTNSHDHAYDPEKALNTWVDQLAPGGCVIIEHTSEHTAGHSNELDPFGADPDVLPYLILQWGKGRYAATEVLIPPFTKPSGHSIWLFVVRRVDV